MLARLTGERQVLLSLSERGTRTLVPFMRLLQAVGRDVNFALLAIGSGLPDSARRMPPVLRAAFIGTLRRCSRIYVESAPLMEELCELELSNVAVLPNPRPRTLHQWRGPSLGSKRVVFVARLTESKGVANAAAAVSKVRSQGIDVSLDIFGPVEPGFEERLDEIVATDSACNYRGVLPSDRVSQVLAGYDALVFPTYWSTEGMPGVLVEAAMVGLPIVTSRFKGVEDLIGDGVEGLLIDAQDVSTISCALSRVLNEPGLAKHLSFAVSERARAFDIEVVVEKLRSDLFELGWR